MIHPHHDLIVQWAKDTTQVVEYFEVTSGKWFRDCNPTWSPHTKYRIRHKHQDLIDQKAARPELIVEGKIDSEWVPIDRYCSWNPFFEYRLVEPVTKKKVKMWQWVVRYGNERPFLDNTYRTAPPTGNGVKVIQRADWTCIEIEVEE